MRIGRFLLTAVITASAVTAMATPQADKGKMDQFIDNLMGKMTLQEKIGQLNLPVSVRLSPDKLRAVMWPGR